MRSQKGAERGRNRHRLQNRSKTAQGGGVSHPRNPLKAKTFTATPAFSRAQKTMDEPSSDSCILQVTGPSSQTWQIGPSREKRVRTREGRQAINLCKRRASSQLKLQTRFLVSVPGYSQLQIAPSVPITSSQAEASAR